MPLATKRALLLIAAMAATSFCVLAAGDSSDRQSAPTLAEANNEFGFRLARELAKAQPGRNICISPFSLASVLQILRNGAAGETRSELDKALETTGFTATNLANSYAGLSRSLKNQSTNGTLEIANAIWFAPGIRLKPPFASLTKAFYDAQIGPLDFTDPRAAGMVNSWVSEKTHGRITQLFQGSLPGNTAALLLNTAYFKGKWTVPFDPARTRKRPFKSFPERDGPVSMMENSGHFLYAADPEAQIVRLPYGNERVGMFVLLPATNSSPQDLLQHLTAAKWADYTSVKRQKINGHIVLPQLKLDCQAELKQSLTALGIHRAFTRGADFSAMAQGELFVDEAIQKVSVEVNEEGTVAAAASAIRMTPTAIEMKSFEMIVDRPFLFAICDRDTQAILFLGLVQDAG